MTNGQEEPTYYDQLIQIAPDRRLVFMNFGLSECEDGADDFSWLLPEDVGNRQHYSMNLVRRVLTGTSLEGRRVLDIACGRGGTCSYMMDYHRPADVWGLDSSLGQIEFCQSTHQHDSLSFRHGDARALPFDDDAFDIVMNIEVSHCYEDVDRFYREVERVLRPGGRFCYADCFSERELTRAEALLEASELSIVEREELTENIIWAIRAGAADLEQLYADAVDPARFDPEAVRAAMKEIWARVLAEYGTGKTVYWCYRLDRK